MNISITIGPSQLYDVLLNVAVVRPVFIWGPPGIGKSALVERFAHELGMECVSLLGSQLAPEDIIGVPQIIEGVSRFCPPAIIARKEPYCLFLDELNACSHEVQKAFYSLIHERRIGDYYLPNGSIIIGAGNRVQDSSIVKPMSAALINRMFHVQLKASFHDWYAWACENDIHPLILDYLHARPDHLWTQPPKTEEPFSTPRSWHMLSDSLKEYGDILTRETLGILSSGCLTPHHAAQFQAFYKQMQNQYSLKQIIDGDLKFPDRAEDRDILYFLCMSFRALLIKDLPQEKANVSEANRQFTHRAKALIKELSLISLEMAQMVVSQHDSERLPEWFMIEVVRDLPRLANRKE